MLNFLLPTYVIAKWSDWDNDYRFLCTFNSHFISNLRAADKFYFKINAREALRRYKNYSYYSKVPFNLEDYDIVDYRELGYSSEDARSTAKYTFG